MLKKGDLVTVSTSQNNNFSNTYVVEGLLEDDRAILTHPIAKDCYFIRNINELNLCDALLKNSEDRMLVYAHKYTKYLDYNDTSILESLCFYRTIRMNLASDQKKMLSNICGKIATIYCHSDISIAIRTVNENQALLDDFNKRWFTNFRNIFGGTEIAKSGRQRETVFNICGFILAQIEV